MRKRAYTLAEVLVSTGMLAVVVATLAMAFVTAAGAVEHTQGRLELERRCRQTLDRIIPYLTAAMPQSQEAIYDPAAGATGTRVDFSTNQDFLGTPPVQFDPRGVPPGPFHRYEIAQQGQLVVLRELYGPVPGPAPLVLGRAVQVEFRRDALNPASLEVRVSAELAVRNAQRQQTLKSFGLQTTVGLPAYSR